MGRPLVVGHATAQRKQNMINDNAVDLGSTWSSDKVSGLFERQNILHNWYFINPVNQRGLMEYARNGHYTIDRWILAAVPSMSVESGFIRLARSNTTGGFIEQIIENPQTYASKTFTASVIYRGKAGGNFRIIQISTQGILSLAGISFPPSDDWRLATFTFTSPEDLSIFTFSIQRRSSDDILGEELDIQAVKLELGTVSTLANDPPPDFGTELVKCQRFYIPIDGNYQALVFSGGQIVWANIPTPATMRINPVLIGSGEIRIFNANGEIISVTETFSPIVNFNKVRVGVRSASVMDALRPATISLHNFALSADL